MPVKFEPESRSSSCESSSSQVRFFFLSFGLIASCVKMMYRRYKNSKDLTPFSLPIAIAS